MAHILEREITLIYPYSRNKLNVPLGSPSAHLDMQLEIKPGTKKIFLRNKAIPSRAREPAALSIYAPLRRFRINLTTQPGGVLKFGFGRDVPSRNLKVDPYKYQFFKKK